MESENLLLIKKREHNEKEEFPAPLKDTNEDHSNNHARPHVSNVFEHQYAEYISGLKPPYMILVKDHRKDDEENLL